MRITLIKDDTGGLLDLDKFSKCCACGGHFNTQIRVERKKDNGMETQVWHLKCLKDYLTKSVITKEATLNLFKSDLALLDKYKDEMVLEELSK